MKRNFLLPSIFLAALSQGTTIDSRAASEWVDNDLHGLVYVEHFPWVYAHGDWIYMTGDNPSVSNEWSFVVEKGWYWANATAFGTMVFSAFPGEWGVMDGPSFTNLLRGRPITLPRLDLFPANLTGGPFEVEETAVVGGELQLRVSFTGGCEPHLFFLATDGEVMESNPPRIRFSLTHNANGDVCEMLVKEELHFDLSDLMESWKARYDAPIIFEVNAGKPWGTVDVKWDF